MPRTPGAAPLDGAQKEADGLRSRFPGQVTALTGSDATRKAVCLALPAARWVHFACHGFSDPANPSASRLLLADHRQRPLTVMNVARLRVDDADLAFLSACSTARPGLQLTDESIHLASAFQLAGYRHVIATMWPIGDKNAADVAAGIYTALGAGRDPAAALHEAASRLRSLQPGRPSVWASHIHIGA